MSWLTPLTGLLVAAVAVPPLLLLYFLKLRRGRRSIPSTLLWKRSVEDVRANVPFQRIRYSLLLLFQMLILLLLVLALAQPQFEGGGSASGRTVIAIDRSASMNALDDPSGRTRLDLAREAAIDRVESLHGGGLFSGGTEQIMVVAFSEGAEVIAPFTDSRQRVIDAIRGIGPTDSATGLGEAIELARVFTTSTDPESLGQDTGTDDAASIEIFSDGRIKDLPELALRDGEQVRYHVIGSDRAPNAGITRIAAERPWNRPNTMQVFAVVDNHGIEPIEVDLELRVDGAPRAVTPRPITVPPRLEVAGGGSAPGREEVAFVPFEQPRGALIEVRLLHQDPLAADNVARLVVPPPQALDVALVGKDPFVLKSLLAGMPLRSLDVLSPADWAGLGPDPESSWDVVIFDGWSPERFPPGRYLVLGSVEGIDELVPFDDGEKVFVRSARDDHPIFRFVNLDELFIWTMPKVVVDGDVEVLAESMEGPVIALVERSGTEILWVAFDVLDSTWWHQRGFANFIPNTVEFLATSGGALVQKALAPGEAISMALPPGSRAVEVLAPDGSRSEGFLDPDGRFSWGPVLQSGIYTVSWEAPASGERATRPVAVNMVDSREGFLDAAPSIELSVDTITATRRARSSLVAVWPWLLVAVLVMLVLEWYVYHRRVG